MNYPTQGASMNTATIWATEDECIERFHSETYPTYEFRIRDQWDNGEFLTGATVDLVERGKVVHSEKFVISSEDIPCEGPWYSSYGSVQLANTHALSYGWAWIEAMEAMA